MGIGYKLFVGLSINYGAKAIAASSSPPSPSSPKLRGIQAYVDFLFKSENEGYLMANYCMQNPKGISVAHSIDTK